MPSIANLKVRCFLAAALLAASSAILAPAALAAQGAQAGCQLRQIAEIPVTMEGNTPLIDAVINGHAVRFLVDTGSAATMISHAGAAELGLQAFKNGYRFYGVGGEDDAGQVTLKTFTLGGATVPNVQIIVSAPGLRSRRYVGLLGEDFLSRMDVELDFAKGVMRLISPKDCTGDQVVFWDAKNYSIAPIAPSANAGELGVYVLLNGQRVLATLDTGAYTSVVTTGAAGQAGVTPHTEGVREAGRATGVGRGSEQQYVAVFPTFTIGDETIKNAKLQIADLFHADREVHLGSHIPTAAADFPSMLLGADFVRAHHIYIARSQGKIYFTYNGGTIFQVIGQKPDEAPAPAAAPTPTATPTPTPTPKP